MSRLSARSIELTGNINKSLSIKGRFYALAVAGYQIHHRHRLPDGEDVGFVSQAQLPGIFLRGKGHPVTLGGETDGCHQTSDPQRDLGGESGLLKEVAGDLSGTLFRIIENELVVPA